MPQPADISLENWCDKNENYLKLRRSGQPPAQQLFHRWRWRVSPKSQDADYEDATPPPAHSFLQVTAVASILQNPSETQPAHITSLNYISVTNIILWPGNILSLHLRALCSVQSTRFVSCRCRCSVRVEYYSKRHESRQMVFDRQRCNPLSRAIAPTVLPLVPLCLFVYCQMS